MLSEYAKLYEQNSDIVGWIRIDDTQMNYPVMQSPQEPNFYLKHGFDKEYTDYGCPYMSESCDVNKPSDNLIVYGHHMKNGTMFSDLEKFKSKEFWEEHKTLRFDSLYVKQTYEVIAVFKTAVYTGSENEFKYYQFIDAATKEQFDGYIQRAKEKAFYDTGVSAEYGDKLITLSTCEYSGQNSRLVVVAKKVTESGGSNAPSNDGATEIQSYSLWSSVLYGITASDDQIVTVALSQIGNVGGEPYWSWYGFGSRVEWCACFVSWCANECGYIDTGVIPKFAGCVNGVQWFKDRGQWMDGSAEPVAGMIIFFDWDNKGSSGPQDGLSDHVGIVQKVENGIVYTVEGNSGDSVRVNQYSVGHYEVLGYGVPQ